MQMEPQSAVCAYEPGGDLLVSSECLSFSRIRHTTPLFQSYLYDFSRVRAFFPRPPLQTGWFPQEAQSLHYPADRRAQVADILERQNRGFGASEKILANINRFRHGACVAVTGQQVGLFGGPLFSLLKALTAVRLSEEATRAGIDCVPIFWLATEDHDLAEVNNSVIPGNDGVLHTLRDAAGAVENTPVGNVVFDGRIAEVVGQAAELLGSAEAVDALRSSYQPGVSFGQAFARLFALLLRDFGIVQIDANDPELHRIAAPLYAESIQRASELDAALLARGEALRRSGFHEQVKVTESSTLLFALRDGVRTVIHRANGQFSLGKERYTEAELRARIAAAPAGFSPNVLLRPIVQDFLLPTLTYVGGPAEVAYFAQAGAAYEKLLGRVTPIWPRLSMTLVEPHAKRLLDRYGLSLTDTLQETEQLRALMAAKTLPAQLHRNFDSAEAALNSSLAEITASLAQLDATLVGAAENAAAKMRYQLQHLRSRAANSELRRNQVLARHAAQLSAALFPRETLQERVIAGVYFLARYPGLLATLYRSTSLACPDHQVLYL
jgi:bacillithiol biosynthesis cysteine-adding enzyme BshC